jgi:hypothetical protein
MNTLIQVKPQRSREAIVFYDFQLEFEDGLDEIQQNYAAKL